MKKGIAVILCLSVLFIGATAVALEKAEPSKNLPPIVAQAYGAAGTIIMWHDIDGDQKADYKAAYIFKDGRIQRLKDNKPSRGALESKTER